MRIVVGFDEKKCTEIARHCGSDSVKKSIAWLRRAYFNNPNKFVCEVIDGVAFWAGDICKSHLRLYEIAVLEEYHGNGYGKAMITRMRTVCEKNNLRKITLRTSKEEQAIQFYKKNGAVIVGEKGNDWEVEIRT